MIFDFLNPISLSFKDRLLEEEFAKEYKFNIVQHVRYALILALVLYLGFAFLDSYLYPNLKSVFHFIRFVLVMPIIALTVVYTYWSSNLKYLQIATSVSALFGTYGIIAMLYIGGEEVSAVYYVGLCLIFIFNYDFLRLRFLPASFVGIITLLGYTFVAMYIDLPKYTLASSLFFLLATNTLGMGSAYFFEALSRKNFYTNLLLNEEQEKVVHINQNLEQQVEERTANLIKTNQELLIAKEKAEESDRLKSVFLSTMSHELRTPLNAIIGFSDFITSKPDEDQENVELAGIIKKSGIHLLGIVESMFEITLIDAGQIKVEKSDFLLIRFIKDFENDLKYEKVKLGKEDLSVSFNTSNLNPDLAISSDYNKLKQILLNLFRNALIFTEKGSINFWCEESIGYNQSYFKFFVQDTGIGIPEDKLEIIFEMFRQVDDSNSRKYGGLGIGLTVVKKMVELLGGEIGVDSTLGVGSTFYFTIPTSITYQSNY